MNAKRFPWILRVLALLSASALAGCGNIQIRPRPELDVPAQAQAQARTDSLEEVLDCIDQRRHGVATLLASLDVALTDHQRGKTHELNGAYLGDKDGNWRLRIKAQEYLIADLSCRNNEITVWLPRRSRFLRGSREDVLQCDGSDLALLARTAPMPELFFPRPWTPDAVERSIQTENGHEVIQVLEESGASRVCVGRFFLSSSLPVTEGIEVCSLTSRRLGNVHFADYTQPGPKDDSADAVYPKQVELRAAGSSYSLKLTVKQVTLNAEVDISKFKIDPPEDQQVLDLAKTLRAGKSLWEYAAATGTNMRSFACNSMNPPSGSS